jgi:hypothetical protein
MIRLIVSTFGLVSLSSACLAAAQGDPFEALASKKFAQCVTIETTRTVTTSPVPGQAVGGCGTGGGGLKSCTADVGPSRDDYVLDTTFPNNSAYLCQKLDGDNPCAFVQVQPIIFTSEKSAYRTFTTNSDRVFLTQAIPQLKVTAVYNDEPQTPRTFYTGTKVSIAIRKSSFSARLECTLTTGDQSIYPISNKDLSDKIKFVKEDNSDPVLNIFTYQIGE